MKDQSFIADTWGVISPILIYYLISLILPAVLAVFFPVLMLEENAMWMLTAANMLMLPVFFRMYRSDRPWRMSFEHDGKPVALTEISLVVLGAVCISRGTNLLLGLTPLPYLFPDYEAFSETIYSCSLVSQITASVISAPLLEELLMRGVFYNRMKITTRNRKLSMLVNALAFGIFHGNVVQGIYAVVLGLFFVALYEKYQSLPLAILAHMTANATSILQEQFPWWEEMIQEPAMYYLQTAVFLLAGLFCWKRICTEKK